MGGYGRWVAKRNGWLREMTGRGDDWLREMGGQAKLVAKGDTWVAKGDTLYGLLSEMGGSGRWVATGDGWLTEMGARDIGV
jgi:hypothetical protein